MLNKIVSILLFCLFKKLIIMNKDKIEFLKEMRKYL